jgi:hypothetical protein
MYSGPKGPRDIASSAFADDDHAAALGLASPSLPHVAVVATVAAAARSIFFLLPVAAADAAT